MSGVVDAHPLIPKAFMCTYRRTVCPPSCGATSVHIVVAHRTKRLGSIYSTDNNIDITLANITNRVHVKQYRMEASTTAAGRARSH